MNSAAGTARLSAFWSWLWADGMAGPVVKLGTGTAVSVSIGLLATPLLTRLYGPGAFGLFGVFSAILAIAVLLGTGRYDQAIALPVADGGAAAVAAVARRLVAVTSIAFCVLWPFGTAMAAQLGYSGIAVWLWLLPPCAWLAGEVQVTSAWAVRRAEYGALARARVAHSVVSVTLQLACAAVGNVALLGGFIAGQVVQCAWLRRITRDQVAHTPAAGLRVVAAEHRRFPLCVLPAALIDTLTFQIPALVGGAWFGIGFVGLYGLATRVLSLPATVAGAALAPVFYQEFSHRLANRAAARDLLFRTWFKLAALGGPPLLTLAYFGPQLFALVFGAEWSGAGDIAVVLSPMFLAMFISSSTSGALLALGAQPLSPVFSVCFLGYRVAGLWAGARAGDYLLGLALVGAAEVVTVAIYNLVILHRLRLVAS